MRVIKPRRLIWAGYVARMEEGRSTFKNLAAKTTENRYIGGPGRRWEDNIIMDF